MKKIYLLTIFNLVFSVLNSQTITISRIDTTSLNSLFFQKLYQIDIKSATSDSIFYHEESPHFQIKTGDSPWCDVPIIKSNGDMRFQLDTEQWELVLNPIPFYFNDTTVLKAIQEGERKVLVRYRINALKKKFGPVDIISNIDTVYIHPLTASEIEGYYFVKNAAINIHSFTYLYRNFGVDKITGPVFVDSLVNNFHHSIWNEIGMYYRIFGNYTQAYINAPGNILSPIKKNELIDRLSILRSSTSWIVRFEAKVLEGRVMADGY